MVVRRLALGAAAALGLGAAGLAAWIALPLPPTLLAPAHRSAVTLTDRHGLPLRSTRAADGSLARWVPLAEMDPDLIAAFLAAEDRRFYEHGALDLRAVARAAWGNLRARRVVSGASTITMQLARLVRPSPRTWPGKVQQALWALRLEHHLDKQAILEQYLNRVPLGQASVGVESAATLYTGGTATDLSLGRGHARAARWSCAVWSSADTPRRRPPSGRRRSRCLLAQPQHSWRRISLPASCSGPRTPRRA
jgi:penicillin-binding protein 1C